MKYTVRPADIKDLETIVRYNLSLANETENKTLDCELVQAGVTRILQDATKGSYFVAVDQRSESDEQVVGQIMFTFEWSDWRNGDILWIQSVYVHPNFRRQGVFRQLYDQIQELVDSNTEYVGIRLYVEKDNDVAQRTYRSLGFSDPGYVVLESLG